MNVTNSNTFRAVSMLTNKYQIIIWYLFVSILTADKYDMSSYYESAPFSYLGLIHQYNSLIHQYNFSCLFCEDVK